MTSVFIDVGVLIIAGIAGAHAVGAAMKEHSLGAIKNTVVGVIGGGCGYFLQAFIPATVDGAGNPVLASDAEHMITLALAGFATAAVLAMVSGFLSGEIFKHGAKSD